MTRYILQNLTEVSFPDSDGESSRRKSFRRTRSHELYHNDDTECILFLVDRVMVVVYVGFEFFQAFEIFGELRLEIIIANEYLQCWAEVFVRLPKSYLKPIQSKANF